MKRLKQFGGVVTGLATLAATFWLCYLSLWVMLVGGICGIIDQCKAPTTDKATIAGDIVMVAFFAVPLIVAAVVAFFGFIGTAYLMTRDK